MLIRVIKYTAYIAGVQEDMQKDPDADVEKNLALDIRRSVLKELDMALTAEGF